MCDFEASRLSLPPSFASMGVFIARAGIDVELMQLQSSSGMVLALGFLPLFAETAFVTVAASYALALSWRWAFLLGYAQPTARHTGGFYSQHRYATPSP